MLFQEDMMKKKSSKYDLMPIKEKKKWEKEK